MRTIIISFFLISFFQINVSLGNQIIAKDTSKVEIKNNSPVITIVDKMPSFKGGEKALYKWLGENIKYPQAAKETGISGTVIVTFIIEKDGSITGIKVLKDIGGGCGEEASRVIKLMPKWKAGKQKGVRVRVQFNLPIRFSLN